MGAQYSSQYTSVSILLFSLHGLYFYNEPEPELTILFFVVVVQFLFSQTGDLCTMSYTRTNGKGAVESRITCKNCLDGTVTSLLTFSDGVGHCFTQEWGPHVGDENGCGDNTHTKDGFNCEDYSSLPNE